MTKEEIGQWVIDNRYSKGENRTVSEHEMYHTVVDEIEKLIKNHGDVRDGKCKKCGNEYIRSEEETYWCGKCEEVYYH